MTKPPKIPTILMSDFKFIEEHFGEHFQAEDEPLKCILDLTWQGEVLTDDLTAKEKAAFFTALGNYSLKLSMFFKHVDKKGHYKGSILK